MKKIRQPIVPTSWLALCRLSLAAVLLAATVSPADTIAPVNDEALQSDTSAPFQELAGDLPDVLSADSGPYLVIADIYVPQGKTVIIAAGTVFLFRNFTSLQVQGTLLARGEKNRPIVFSSENDRLYSESSTLDPAPYDWNGITIHTDAIGTHLSHCVIHYSVYGINSLTRFIRIDQCTFRHNGRGNFMVEGTEQKVGEGPCVYALSSRDASKQGVPVTILKDPLALRRNMCRYAGLTVGISALAGGVWYNSRYRMSSEQFRLMSGDDPGNLATNSSVAWESARSRKNSDAVGMLLFYAVGLTGATAFSWSFNF